MENRTRGAERVGEYEFRADGVTLTVMAGEPDFFLPGPEDSVRLKKPMHTHPWYEFFYVREGTLGFFTDHATEKIGAGEFLLVAPGFSHYTEPTAAGADRYVYNFYVERDAATPLAEKLTALLSYSGYLRFPADGEMKAVSEGLAMSLAGGRGHAAGCYTLLLLLRAAALCATEPTADEILSDNGISRIYKIEQIFNRFYKENLPIGRVAEALHLSERQLSRIIRQTYGCTYRERMTALRMQTAAALLSEGMAVSLAANAVGYDSLCGFTGAFRKVYGVTPSAYQRECKASVD